MQQPKHIWKCSLLWQRDAGARYAGSKMETGVVWPTLWRDAAVPSTEYRVPGNGYRVPGCHSSRSHIAAHFINSSWNEAAAVCVLHANAAVKRAGEAQREEPVSSSSGKGSKRGGESQTAGCGCASAQSIVQLYCGPARFRSAVWAARSWKHNSSHGHSCRFDWRLQAAVSQLQLHPHPRLPLRAASYAEVMPAKPLAALASTKKNRSH